MEGQVSQGQKDRAVWIIASFSARTGKFDQQGAKGLQSGG